MNEETVVESPVETNEPEVTLEEVYKSVEEPTPQQAVPQQAVPQQQYIPTQGTPPSIPDPYDAEAFKAYLVSQQQGTTALHQALNGVVGYLTQMQAKEAKTSLEADISKAVSSVNEIINYPKPKVIEAMLDAKAREDSRFKSIWENRGKNPIAWDKALKAVSREFADDLSVKIDPKLVESQRARKAAQKQMATSSPDDDNSIESKLGNAQGSDFENEWSKLIQRA